MKLTRISIQNYRSCRDVTIHLGPMTSLVGANNAGKSCILRAIDFLFNPAPTKLSEESFWALDTSLRIWVEGLFTDLTPVELERFSPYLRPDGTLQISRSATITGNDQSESDADTKIKISQHYCKPTPKYPWLAPANITGAAIEEWWNIKDTLIANGHCFTELAGTSKPNVSIWKEKAFEFASSFLSPEDYEDIWADNPQGYAGVLKAFLPHFILVPAVRDLADETKAAKTSPLGRLLYSIIEAITEEQSDALAKSVQEMQMMLNRKGGEKRLSSIIETESSLNAVLHEYMDCEVEIEFQPPTLEVLLSSPRIYADDGFRNLVENKGHGLQRAILFSILRCYSQLVTGQGEEKTRTMIFAVEEPELYMHPQAQRTIRRVFQAICSIGDQVVFSTHSALLLDVAHFDEIVRVESLPVENKGQRTVFSRVWQLPMESMIADIAARHPKVQPTSSSIRELYANAYHPTRAEGFFAKRLILVEGQTEHYALPVYARTIGLHLDSLNIGIIDCGGKGPMDRLYRIFNELGIPCYILFDYDKKSTDKDCVAKSRQILEMMGLPSDPPDTTIITERIACFPSKWEEDLASEIPDYVKLAQEARKYLGLTSDSGKPLVARYIATQLAEKNPPYIPPSLQSILKAAVAIDWSQSCLAK